ncbi:hypothetical protein QT979_23465, partial [Microcoleus sp. w2-18bC1]|uniref:hypothetical protein n=1 Tax=unclassified Microcoleus TaxID=2642155 RepID=UPI002FD42B58
KSHLIRVHQRSSAHICGYKIPSYPRSSALIRPHLRLQNPILSAFISAHPPSSAVKILQTKLAMIKTNVKNYCKQL